jgi:hypothetical protein
MYKMILNKLYSLFSFNKYSGNKSIVQPKLSYMDVTFSLNTDLEIDINVYLKDSDYPLSTQYYGLLCAEFLNIIQSGNLDKTVMNILDKQITNDDNKILIQTIFHFLDMVQNKQQITASYIKPSQVFSKYVI